MKYKELNKQFRGNIFGQEDIFQQAAEIVTDEEIAEYIRNEKSEEK